jgi:PBP1b-binding outer membrane lipoprotein LpoB
MRRNRWILAAVVIGALLLAGCAPDPVVAPGDGTEPAVSPPTNDRYDY